MTDAPKVSDLWMAIDPKDPRAATYQTAIENAFAFSQQHHLGQTRRSGEAFFYHPFRVALIIAREMKLDAVSVLAALLHDLVEDTKVTLKVIEEKFGVEVAQLVDGLTKLSQVHFRSNQEKQAENFRKMLVSMSKDIRVVLIKLADRLDNMRTIQSLPDIKRRRIAKETIEIYAPLANRLGMGNVKTELEDIAFSQLNPETYNKLKKEVTGHHTVHEKFIEDIRRDILKLCYENNLVIEVQWRVKHLYSVFTKMQDRNLNLDQVFDIVAFRIITKTVMECYEVLGILHSMWRPIPGRFKDYIAMPKPNLYQSLHTTVVGPKGQPVEIQIRTEQMNQVAETGIAAHWRYKEPGVGQDPVTHFDWLTRLLKERADAESPHEFISNVKTDLFGGDIYVFTPNGDVLEFPEGATPIDFAYEIHTEIGHKTTGAIVNGKIVPLKYQLRSGDIVEIITSDKSRPSKDWLKFVKTTRARHKLRAYLRTQERDASAKIGRQLIESAFRKKGKGLNQEITKDSFRNLVIKFNCTDANEFFISVGYGKIAVQDVLNFYFAGKTEQAGGGGPPAEEPTILQKIFQRARSRTPKREILEVAGVDDVLLRVARCCNPLPGDDILGYVTLGRGVTVHSTDCLRVPDFDSQRIVEVRWKADQKQLHHVVIRVISEDAPGLLSKMSSVFQKAGVNISKAQVSTSKDNRAINDFHVHVHDLNELNTLLTKLEKIAGVISVTRERGEGVV